MTKQEFGMLAMGMKAVWPTQNLLPDDASMDIWYRLLQDLPYELASAAVQKYMTTNRFPPTIADIREQCANVQQGEQRDWLEGWGLVIRAIHRYGWSRPEDALDAIRAVDPVAAKTAEMMGWQNLCVSENQTADRANFRTCYETAQKREKEAAALPPTVKAMLKSVTENLKLGDGKNGLSLRQSNEDFHNYL